jgi:spore coat polysaccharide biosynthesis predicted glycosyltransferase SpsG
MAKSDFSIVTPSVTLNEIYFMEIPFIAIKTAKNQDDMYRYLKKKKHFVMSRVTKTKLKKYVELLLNRDDKNVK